MPAHVSKYELPYVATPRTVITSGISKAAPHSRALAMCSGATKPCNHSFNHAGAGASPNTTGNTYCNITGNPKPAAAAATTPDTIPNIISHFSGPIYCFNNGRIRGHVFCSFSAMSDYGCHSTNFSPRWQSFSIIHCQIMLYPNMTFCPRLRVC